MKAVVLRTVAICPFPMTEETVAANLLTLARVECYSVSEFAKAYDVYPYGIELVVPVGCLKNQNAQLRTCPSFFCLL